MTDLAELTLAIRSEQVAQANSRLDHFERNARGAAQQARNLSNEFHRNEAAANRVGRSYQNLLRWLASLGAGYAALRAAQTSLRLAGEAEQTQIQFETLLRSAEQGRMMIAEIKKLAVETPFEFPQLAQAGRQLLAYKFAAQDVPQILRTIVDAASLTGGAQNIEAITRALGQIQARGKAAAQDLNQLSEVGINAFDMLAKAAGIAETEMRDLISKGVVDGTEAVRAILLGLEKDFGGGAEKLSKTFLGRLSTLLDAIKEQAKELGNAILEAFDLKTVVLDMTSAVETFGHFMVEVVRVVSGLPPQFEEWRQAAENLVDVLKTMAIIIGTIVGIKLAIWLVGVAQALVAAAAAVAAFTAAWWPLLAVVLAVGGALAAFEFGRYIFTETEVGARALVELQYQFDLLIARIKLLASVLVETFKPAMATLVQVTAVTTASVIRGVKAMSAVTGVVIDQTLNKMGVAGDVAQAIIRSGDSALVAGATAVGVATGNRAVLDAASLFEKRRAEAEAARAAGLANLGQKFGPEGPGGKSFTEFLSGDFKTAMNTAAYAAKELSAWMQSIFTPTGGGTTTVNVPGVPTTQPGSGKLKFEVDANKLKGALGGLSTEAKQARKVISELFQEVRNERELVGLVGDERERAEKLLKLDEAIEKAGMGNSLGGLAVRERYINELKQLQKLKDLEKIADGIGDAFAQAFGDIAFGAKSASEAMRDFYMTVSKLIFNQLVAQPLAQNLSRSIFGLFGSIVPGFYGPTIGPYQATQTALNMTTGATLGYRPFASGGILDRPTFFPMGGGTGLAGEAGAEAILPLGRDGSGRLGVRGGASTVNNFNFKITTPNADSFRQSRGQIKTDIGRFIKRKA